MEKKKTHSYNRSIELLLEVLKAYRLKKELPSQVAIPFSAGIIEAPLIIVTAWLISLITILPNLIN